MVFGGSRGYEALSGGHNTRNDQRPGEQAGLDVIQRSRALAFLKISVLTSTNEIGAVHVEILPSVDNWASQRVEVGFTILMAAARVRNHSWLHSQNHDVSICNE